MARPPILIRQYGRVIQIGPIDGSPVPVDIHQYFESNCAYNHVSAIRGKAKQFGPTTQRVHTEFVRLYESGRDREGRQVLVTGAGYLPRLACMLSQFGYEYEYVDLTPPPRHPELYVPRWDRVQARFSLRPGQREALEAIANNPGGLINAAAGFGKTWLFGPVCHMFPHARIDICVRQADVAADIRTSLLETIPNVGKFGGSGRDGKGDRVTVFTNASLHKADGDADIILADECDLLMAQKSCETFCRAYLGGRAYGFTATLERTDGAHARLEPIFGPLIVQLTTPQAVALGLTSQIRIEWLPIREGPDLSNVQNTTVKRRRGIWRNELRNRIFVDHYRQYNANCSQVLFLTDTIEHAVHLRALLPEFEICTGVWSKNMDVRVNRWKRDGLLPEDFQPIDATHRERIRREFAAGMCKRVIANDIWSTGVSFDALPLLYRLDSRESSRLDVQASGRVGRQHESKVEGRVIDGLDLWDKGFRRKSTVRHRHYAAEGYIQTGWVTS